MSVLIKGMEMPTEGGTICVYKISGKFFSARAGKAELFPIIPIQEPHGRLISADELIEFIENRYEITWKDDYEGGIKDACVDVLEKISTMPTIIPASEEGKK